MKKWEYSCRSFWPVKARPGHQRGRVRPTHDSNDVKVITSWLDELGQEGWEMVNAVFVPGNMDRYDEVLYYLRRPCEQGGP